MVNSSRMESYLIVGVLVTACLIVHVAVHRLIRPTIFNNAIYAVGFFVLLFFARQGLLSLPMTGFVLYVTASLFLSYFYMTLFLGGQTPASMILESFLHRKRQTYGQLLSLFSEQGLIWQRVRDLISAGLVIKAGGRFVLTKKGRIVASAIG